MPATFVATDFLQCRRLAVAAINGVAATGRKRATRNWLLQRGHDARYLLQAPGARSRPAARDRAQQPSRVGMGRPVEQFDEHFTLAPWRIATAVLHD